MTRKLLTVAAAAMALGAPTLAMSPQERHAYNSLQQEAIDCAAFVSTMAAWMFERGDDAAGTVAWQTSKLYVEGAFHLGEGMGEQPKVTEARLWAAWNRMKAETNGHDPARASMLMQRYTRPCKLHLENVRARLRYWMKKARRRGDV